MKNIKLNDKSVLWFLSIVSALLLINTYLKQFSENKMNDYRNNLEILQSKENCELSRVLYYTINSNQNETMSLLLLMDKNITLDSNLIPKTDSVDNIEIKEINKRQDKLQQKLKTNQIPLSNYYKEKLKISSGLYSEHFNNYNKLNADYLNELKNPTSWLLWNKVCNFLEMLLILLNVLGQLFLIIKKFGKIK
jgi:hypothetical protein